jgi:hypothetical protein
MGLVLSFLEAARRERITGGHALAGLGALLAQEPVADASGAFLRGGFTGGAYDQRVAVGVDAARRQQQLLAAAQGADPVLRVRQGVHRGPVLLESELLDGGSRWSGRAAPATSVSASIPVSRTSIAARQSMFSSQNLRSVHNPTPSHTGHTRAEWEIYSARWCRFSARGAHRVAASGVNASNCWSTWSRAMPQWESATD